ncbi:MAG: nidogen-like domain-containing protein [Planctomycetota bacterium]
MSKGPRRRDRGRIKLGAETLESREMLFGPDAFGYTATAIDFDFEDISATGVATLSGIDDSFVTLGPAVLEGFDFSLYEQDYTSVSYSSNGLITFDAGVTDWSNTDLTTFPSQAAIAPLWDDLVTFDGGAVYWDVRGDADDQRLIIQWDNVAYINNASDDRITFQAVLSEIDDSVRFNYLDITTVGDSRSEGASATVGIKDAGSTAALVDQLVPSVNAGPNEFVGPLQSTLISRASTDPVLPNFEPIDPLGSLVYGSEVRGVFETLGDDDTITIDVAQGQDLAVLVETETPGAAVLRDPFGEIVPGGAAVLLGEPALLTTPAPTVDGVYTLELFANPEFSGVYDVTALLNADFERETFGGVANDLLGAAEDLEFVVVSPSVDPLPVGPIRRTGVMGELAGPTDQEDWYRFSLSEDQSSTTVVTPLDGPETPLVELYVDTAMLPGDFNADGVVDLIDYTVMYDSMGSATPMPNDPTPAQVGSDDYDTWIANFGLTTADITPQLELVAAGIGVGDGQRIVDFVAPA